MKNVSRQNFNDSYSELEQLIKNASFIAIDTEFTGIQSAKQLKNSLFDSLSDRYKTLKTNIQPFIAIQFGITTFQHIRSESSYKATCFNFYLVPRSVPIKNRQFSCQVAALEFLSTHEFDFNSFAKNGISYLDEVDEELLKKYINSDSILNLENLSYQEEKDYKDYKNRFYEWLKGNEKEISFVIPVESPLLRYLLNKEIRKSHPQLWTTSDGEKVAVLRIPSDLKQLVQKKAGTYTLKEQLLNSYVGFSKVFKLLHSTKKPIIGHNILLDLMFIHQQFYKPLPNNYYQFKWNIHDLFPQIYDTKFLSYELKKILSKEAHWKLNSLGHMFEYFKSGKGKQLTCGQPHIVHPAFKGGESYHNAGWDAYCAGYIFLKMAHMFSVNKFGGDNQQKTMAHSELMNSVKCFANCVNTSRMNEMYMSLDGDDPPSVKPEWLHVTLSSPNSTIKQIAEKFSQYGCVDIMPSSRKHLLVAVSNYKSAHDILNNYKNSKEFYVRKYNPILHAPPKRIILWSGIVLSGGVVTWMIHRIFNKCLTNC